MIPNTNIKEINEYISQLLDACRDYRKELTDTNKEVARLREYLTREASRASDIHNRVLIVECLRYLRDEVQKQERPLAKAPNDLHAWMRLQEEINREVAGEIRYLRDEIEQLKKNQK